MRAPSGTNMCAIASIFAPARPRTAGGGDEYVRDCIHLRAGEIWNDRLRELIDQADAFQLFWSSAAMHSLFVRQEYEHALALNRPSFVRPTYWEDPLPTAPGLPPPSLQRL